MHSDNTFHDSDPTGHNGETVEINTGSTVEFNGETVELNGETVEFNTPEFPASKRETAKFLGVSDMTVGRWIEKLESVGIVATDHKNRVSSHGYKHLKAIKDGTENGLKVSEYIATLIPLETVTIETDPSLTDDIFGEAKRKARLQTEIKSFMLELETDRQLDDEIREMRQAKIEEIALSEFLEEEKTKANIKRRLRLQKLQVELESDV